MSDYNTLLYDQTTHMVYAGSSSVLFGTSNTSSYAITSSYISSSFSRGGTLINPSGLTTTGSFVVWNATKTCVVTNVKGYKTGGTGITFNARKSGSLNHLISNQNVTVDDIWIDGGITQNTDYSIGDKMEITIASITGSVTQIAIQIDLKR